MAARAASGWRGEGAARGPCRCQTITHRRGGRTRRPDASLAGKPIAPLLLFLPLPSGSRAAAALSPRSAPHSCLTPRESALRGRGAAGCAGPRGSGSAIRPASASRSPQRGPSRGAAALTPSHLCPRLTPADSLGSGSWGRKWRALVMILIKPAGLSADADPAHQSAVKSTVQRHCRRPCSEMRGTPGDRRRRHAGRGPLGSTGAWRPASQRQGPRPGPRACERSDRNWAPGLLSPGVSAGNRVFPE